MMGSGRNRMRSSLSFDKAVAAIAIEFTVVVNAVHECNGPWIHGEPPNEDQHFVTACLRTNIIDEVLGIICAFLASAEEPPLELYTNAISGEEPMLPDYVHVLDTLIENALHKWLHDVGKVLFMPPYSPVYHNRLAVMLIIWSFVCPPGSVWHRTTGRRMA